jgi:predicted metal-binding membrane protein
MTDFRSATSAASAAGGDLRVALVASRAQRGLIVLLFTLAAVAWWWTVRLMRGMDNGPWTALGTFGWFVGVWVVMMAAMMFPSVAPTIALYARMSGKSRLMPVLFTGGYLLTWAGAGVIAFVIGLAASRAGGGQLSWDHAGRPAAGAMLILAAGYELTPLKNACLGRCRSPLGTLLRSWHGGWSGALRMGAQNGAWCVGCCWALMASLFALGVMSVTWMALVAGFIAVEKILPWRRTATYGTAVVLLVLGVLVLVAPDALPGLTVPGHDSVPVMSPMKD